MLPSQDSSQPDTNDTSVQNSNKPHQFLSPGKPSQGLLSGHFSSVRPGQPQPATFQSPVQNQLTESQPQQFAPYNLGATSKPVTDRQPTPPETGRQQTVPFQPYETGRQQAVPETGHPQAFPFQPADPSPQNYLPPSTSTKPGLLAMYGFNNISTTPNSIPSMPSLPSVPSLSSLPSMPTYPLDQQQGTPTWPARNNRWTENVPVPPPPAESYVPTRPLPPNKIARRTGISLLAVAVCLLMVVAVVALSQTSLLSFHGKQTAISTPVGSHTTTTTGHAPAPTATAGALNSITNNTQISPFLFGTNMALFHDTDETILNSAATRQQLRNIGVRIIRMPERTSLKPETEIAAATAIRDMGASALVVMHGPGTAALYQADLQVVQSMTAVFGKQSVYFEFGNESDLNGITVTQYIQQWNLVIPPLKQQFPTARFIGPDNYQFTRRYLKTFLQQAKPLPDGVSWHEYTCSVKWSAAFCLANLDSWPIHFTQARAAMQEAIGRTLPIWITEWNYTSDQAVINGQPIDDGKYNNPAFMQTWTTKAMQLLISYRIFAAMQYFATNQPMPLVYNDQIGIEGKIFQQNYQSVMVNNQTPALASYQPPAPVSTPNAQYSFENLGTSGWMAMNTGITPPVNSTARAVTGTHSLRFTLQDASEDDTPGIAVNANAAIPSPKAGQMISVYIYVANPRAVVNAKIFVSGPNYAWQFANSITLTPGVWNKVWYSLPLTYTSHVVQYGIQFFTATPGVSTDVYMDDFAWQ